MRELVCRPAKQLTLLPAHSLRRLSFAAELAAPLARHAGFAERRAILSISASHTGLPLHASAAVPKCPLTGQRPFARQQLLRREFDRFRLTVVTRYARFAARFTRIYYS